MPMNYLTALDHVISRGITAARSSYSGRDELDKLDGSISGFEACRNKTPIEIWELYQKAARECTEAKDRQDIHWKYFACRRSEIEWVANCVSVILLNEKIPSPFPRHVGPTVRATLAMTRILGLAVSD